MPLSEMLKESTERLRAVRDNEGQPLRIASILVSNYRERARYDFTPNPGAVDIHSLTKVITCLTAGRMIECGITLDDVAISLDMPICKYIPALPGLADTTIDQRWKSVQLRHMLNCTIGHKEGFLFRREMHQLNMNAIIPYVFSKPLDFQPGMHFSYSNVGTFLFSAFIQELTGRRFSDWAQELLLQPLSFGPVTWLQYGQYDAACSGALLTIENVHKLGELLRDGGIYSGQRIIGQKWVEAMITPQVRADRYYDSRRAFPQYAYGLGIWICDNGVYFCYGTDGQYIIVLPKTRTVISITAIQPDMSLISECFRNFRELEDLQDLSMRDVQIVT